MSENNIQGIMDTTLEKLRTMVEADTIIGTPIKADGITLIPISRVSFGLATGGSDIPAKTDNKIFGGGGGAGVSIVPIAFIAVNGSDVKMMPIYNDLNTIDKAISMVPELIEKVKSLFAKEEIKFDQDGNIQK
ncbi:MAG: GerW family sporulation protein [Clostridia bacterium]|nr:GerW family sporulation protein [Clostridia bacterium]